MSQASVVPSSHYREEGWMRRQENGAQPPSRRRRGGVPFRSTRNTTPASRRRRLRNIFLDRSATPPRGNARRGLRLSITFRFSSTETPHSGKRLCRQRRGSSPLIRYH